MDELLIDDATEIPKKWTIDRALREVAKLARAFLTGKSEELPDRVGQTFLSGPPKS